MEALKLGYGWLSVYCHVAQNGEEAGLQGMGEKEMVEGTGQKAGTGRERWRGGRDSVAGLVLAVPDPSSILVQGLLQGPLRYFCNEFSFTPKEVRIRFLSFALKVTN